MNHFTNYDLPDSVSDEIVNSDTGEQYQVYDKIHHGAESTVFAVKNSKGRELAVKRLDKNVEGTDRSKICQNEAKIHASLPAHPGICKVFSTWSDSNYVYIALERLHGPNLYQWRWSSHQVSTSRSSSTQAEMIKDIFLQILDVVGVVHAAGVAHRDLQPSNFIITMDTKGNPVVKLVDFGNATRDTVSRNFDVGSLAFMPYECRSKNFFTYQTTVADIWTLGIVFLFLTFGKYPWDDPHISDDHFAAYIYDSKLFFRRMYPELTPKAAGYLVENIFTWKPTQRAPLYEFRSWAVRLDDTVYGATNPANKPSASILLQDSPTLNSSHKASIDYSDSGLSSMEVDSISSRPAVTVPSTFSWSVKDSIRSSVPSISHSPTLSYLTSNDSPSPITGRRLHTNRQSIISSHPSEYTVGTNESFRSEGSSQVGREIPCPEGHRNINMTLSQKYQAPTRRGQFEPDLALVSDMISTSWAQNYAKPKTSSSRLRQTPNIPAAVEEESSEASDKTGPKRKKQRSKRWKALSPELRKLKSLGLPLPPKGETEPEPEAKKKEPSRLKKTLSILSSSSTESKGLWKSMREKIGRKKDD
ncbi:Serine/threonine-protein kinase ksp1 [Neolecta irregularis DAH-3]|uniref:Serine/threonine-protein kinase ksp1 n=1 Tax=Neolecta irregularis (strain DAH-3) TaxID=1198029 RepID=A0A1U7LIR3_NEOID|nr:Serine/threonine-protein kinase ksp1 [Neolecta irregularis DAH-3]|eukprot:OLL22556.1 Serine/threonine-protein kinase ksp1 [Neolecta irregularis DAH-3]